MMDRLPPQNLKAEESILSGCLLDKEMAEDAIELLVEDDFYKPAHSKIFKAIKSLHHKQEPVDLTTVATHMIDTGQSEAIGGAAYLSVITDQPIPPNVEHYAGLIKHAATLRKTIALCSDTINTCYGGDHSLAEVLNLLQSNALELGVDNNKQEFCTMEELSHQSFERYEAMREKTSEKSIQTGFYQLDRLTGGLKGSKLIIIAARPSIGKTAFMCNMVENMAGGRTKVGVFSLEMDKEDLDDRWNASLAGINTIRLTSSQKLDAEEWNRLTNVAERKSEWPVLIDDTGGMCIDEIVRRSRKMKRMGCEIIYIDQLSFIRAGKRKSIFEANTEHVEALGHLKKELRIPIVLLAQLNREVEKRGDKKPMLSDLKNTGMLEEAADLVLLGYRKYYYSKLPEDENHAAWELAKNRGGPTMDIEMVWLPKQAKFENKAMGY